MIEPAAQSNPGAFVSMRSAARAHPRIPLHLALQGLRRIPRERADENIDDVLRELQGTSHRLRQRSIDEELFDVVAGFEALK